MVLIILSLLFLASPTLWEIWHDRRGDADKFEDTVIRLFWMASAALIVGHTPIDYLIAFNMSVAIHFLFFDYSIQYILIKNGTLEPPRGVKYHWFTYQAKAGVIDNIGLWRNMNPWVKLCIRVGYFTMALMLFL